MKLLPRKEVEKMLTERFKDRNSVYEALRRLVSGITDIDVHLHQCSDDEIYLLASQAGITITKENHANRKI